jgi:hypothetical protein
MTELDWEGLITKLDDLGATPLSYSKMQVLFNCPLRYYHQYICKSERGIPLDKEPAVVGKFIHNILEFCMTKGASYGYTEEAIDFNRVWAAVSKQMPLTQKEYDMAQDQRIHAKNVLIRMLELVTDYKMRVYPELRIILSKDLHVSSNVPWKSRLLWGFVDFVGITKSGKQALIIDYKTHGKSDNNATAVDTQTRIYGYLLMLMFPTLQKVKMGAAYVPDELVEAPAVITREDMPSTEKEFYEALKTFMEALTPCVDEEKYLPIKGDKCKWCNYFHECPLMQE